MNRVTYRRILVLLSISLVADPATMSVLFSSPATIGTSSPPLEFLQKFFRQEALAESATHFFHPRQGLNTAATVSEAQREGSRLEIPNNGSDHSPFVFFKPGETQGASPDVKLHGRKGWSVAAMAADGYPVPPGFIVPIPVAMDYLHTGELPTHFVSQVKEGIHFLEKATGLKLGDPAHPLVLSVRGGSNYSMPGYLATITNVGLVDEATIEGLALRDPAHPNRFFAYDSYFRFLVDYAWHVHHIIPREFQRIVEQKVAERKVVGYTDLTADDLKEITQAARELIVARTQDSIQTDPILLLLDAIKAVIRSWERESEKNYRERARFDQEAGIAVTIQKMVFGNLNERSATGIAISRNPLNGEPSIFGEWKRTAQGKDVGGRKKAPEPQSALETEFPRAAQTLSAMLRQAEIRTHSVQEVEWTIENEGLWFLQLRDNAQRITPWAMARTLIDFVNDQLLEESQALARITARQLKEAREFLLARRVQPNARIPILTRGIPASPGIAQGRVVFDRTEARERAEKREAIILVTDKFRATDHELLTSINGILAVLGGATTHEAIWARGDTGIKPVIVGAEKIQLNGDYLRVGEHVIRKNDFLILDGYTGNVILGPAIGFDEDSEVTKVLQYRLDPKDALLYPYYRKINIWLQRKLEDESRERADLLGQPLEQRVEQLLERAREIMRESRGRTDWYEPMNQVAQKLICVHHATSLETKPRDEIEFWEFKGPFYGWDEITKAIELLYEKDPTMLGRILHANAGTHEETLEVFRLIVEQNRPLAVHILDTMANFRPWAYTGIDLDHYREFSKYSSARMLLSLPEGLQGELLRAVKFETFVALLEESAMLQDVLKWQLTDSRFEMRVSPDKMDATLGMFWQIAASVVLDRRDWRFQLFGGDNVPGLLSNVPRQKLETQVNGLESMLGRQNRIIEIAEKISPTQGEQGSLKSVKQLRDEYIEAIVPRSEKKSNDASVLQAVFRYANGLALIPTLFAFTTIHNPNHQSLLQRVSENSQAGISLQQLAEEFNPGHEAENMGARSGFTRALVYQHWVKIEGKDEQTACSLTDLGKSVLKVAETQEAQYTLELAARAFRHLKDYHAYFRTADNDLTEEARGALEEYRNLIALSQQEHSRWGIPDDRLYPAAVEELRNALDGALMSPTIIALGMPDYQKMGLMVKEWHPAFYQESARRIDLNELEFAYNKAFLRAAFNLLASQRPSGQSLGKREGQVFEFSEYGVDLMRRRGSFGVPGSYIQGLQSDYVRDMIANPNNPDPIGLDHYAHVDPFKNAWGTEMTHPVYMRMVLEQVLIAVENGARGVTELGAGSGRIVAMAGAASVGWLNILKRYNQVLEREKRPKLQNVERNGPFFVIGSDITDTALERIGATFAQELGGIEGLRYELFRADITQIDDFAKEVRNRLGVDANQLVNLMMFVIEERNFQVRDQSEAQTIFRNALEQTLQDPEGRELLTAQLVKMGALKPGNALPDRDDLVHLVSEQFNISHSERGRLVQALVSAADLIQFMERLRKIGRRGLIILDVNTPDHERLDGVNVGMGVVYWLIHLFREKVYTAMQCELAYLLAGFRFAERQLNGPKGAALVGFSALQLRDHFSAGVLSSNPAIEPSKPTKVIPAVGNQFPKIAA